MERLLRLTLLYDFYGELLTEKQRSFFEMYNFSDLSLNEIAGELGISPQGVRDMLKRTERILLNYDENLGLLAKHSAQKQKIEALAGEISRLDIEAGRKSKLLAMLREIL